MSTGDLAKKVLDRIEKASAAGNYEHLDVAMADGWNLMRRARMFPLDWRGMVDVLKCLSKA